MRVFTALVLAACVSAGELTGGTAALNTLVEGETPTSFQLSLGISTVIANDGTITVTYDVDTFLVQTVAFSVVANPANGGDITAKTTSLRVIEFTAPSGISAGTTTFTITANLAPNVLSLHPFSAVSTPDQTAHEQTNSYTTTAIVGSLSIGADSVTAHTIPLGGPISISGIAAGNHVC